MFQLKLHNISKHQQLVSSSLMVWLERWAGSGIRGNAPSYPRWAGWAHRRKNHRRPKNGKKTCRVPDPSRAASTTAIGRRRNFRPAMETGSWAGGRSECDLLNMLTWFILYSFIYTVFKEQFLLNRKILLWENVTIFSSSQTNSEHSLCLVDNVVDNITCY